MLNPVLCVGLVTAPDDACMPTLTKGASWRSAPQIVRAAAAARAPRNATGHKITA